jgi:hypothetical protein
VITTGITEQAAELILEERRNAIVESIFVPCEQPVLETPAPLKQKNKPAGRVKALKTAVRRSTRQLAKGCSVPVHKRATHRLTKAFETVGLNEPIGDEALAAFAKRFDTAVPQNRLQQCGSLLHWTVGR